LMLLLLLLLLLCCCCYVVVCVEEQKHRRTNVLKNKLVVGMYLYAYVEHMQQKAKGSQKKIITEQT
jgi:hypothetical protein